MGRGPAEWPIRFAESKTDADGTRVSFIIAHGGRSRLPQLCLTLKSLFAQTEIDLECVVVDQSEEPIFAELPPEIVYRHLTKAGVDQGGTNPGLTMSVRDWQRRNPGVP